MPRIVAGSVAISVRLSIGTSTFFAPFSDNMETLSLKFKARSIAPPILILPIIPSPDFKFLPKIDDTIPAKTTVFP